MGLQTCKNISEVKINKTEIQSAYEALRKAKGCEPTCVSMLPWSSGRVSGKGSLCMKMCSVCTGECIF